MSKLTVTLAMALLSALLTSSCTLEQDDSNKVLWPLANTKLSKDPKVEQRVAELVQQMTVEQKVAQIIQPEISFMSLEQMRQYGFGSYLIGGNTHFQGNKLTPAQDWLAYADQMHLASVDASQDGSSLPTMWGIDAMHGHSNVFGATLFPHNIGLGAANDPELIRRIGDVTAKEVAATGIEWLFAPTVAVARDDRWGRTYESFSEDPTIVHRYASYMVEGVQGTIGDDFLQHHRRIATAKHFVGDGGTEKGVDQGHTWISEQELRDIHAPGYFSAIESGVQSVMASFNSWQGLRLHGHKYLLTDVLKEQMGFDGFVISDWNGHRYVEGCSMVQCPDAINAGIDVLMVAEHFEPFFHNTVRQVKQGIIPMERLNDAVSRFLRAKIRWGLLDRGKPSERAESALIKEFNSHQHRELAREAVRKSLVLLKNNDELLPLSPKQHILVAGDAANSMAKQLGGWSLSWNGTDNKNSDFPAATTIYQGIKQQVEAAGGSVQFSEKGHYQGKPDVAVVVIGEPPYAEWTGDRQHLEYQLNDKQDLQLLKKLKSAGIPVVTVFISGRPLWVNKELNASDAFVAAWLPGTEGQGVADVLLTDSSGQRQYDFTGKLSFSWPKTDIQYQLNYQDPDYDPLFAYGYGLSYGQPNNLPNFSEKTLYRASSEEQQDWPLFTRTLAENLHFTLSVQGGNRVLADKPLSASADGTSLIMQSVNMAYQEDARKLVWNSKRTASFHLGYSKANKPPERIAQQRVLTLDIKIDQPPTAKVELAALCSEKECAYQQDITQQLLSLSQREWHTLAVDLSCLSLSAESKLLDVLKISSRGQLNASIAAIQLQTVQSDSVMTLKCH